MIKGLIHFGITERKNEVSVFWRLLRLLQPNIRRKSKVENLWFSPFLIKVFSFYLRSVALPYVYTPTITRTKISPRN